MRTPTPKEKKDRLIFHWCLVIFCIFLTVILVSIGISDKSWAVLVFAVFIGLFAIGFYASIEELNNGTYNMGDEDVGG